MTTLAGALAAAGCGADLADMPNATSQEEKVGNSTQSLLDWDYDATVEEVRATGCSVDDLDGLGWAHAGRSAHQICARRGRIGGIYSGLYGGGRFGLRCHHSGARLFDVYRRDIVDSGWDFDDLDRVHWAYAGRSAHSLCTRRGFVGGYYSGLHSAGRYGLTCASGRSRIFDLSRRELADLGYRFDRFDRLGWGYASRIARSACLRRGFYGGRFTGFDYGDRWPTLCF